MSACVSSSPVAAAASLGGTRQKLPPIEMTGHRWTGWPAATGWWSGWPAPLIESEGQVAGLLHSPLPGGMGSDAAQVHPAGAVLDEYQNVQSSEPHGVYVQKVDREDPSGLGCQELPPGRPVRRGAGSMPAACRISHTVDGTTARPSLVSSPWIRRYPHSGFSFARRMTRRAMLRAVGGRRSGLSADDRACAACSYRT